MATTDDKPTQPGEEKLVYLGKRPIGFVRRTRGGFYRGYSYVTGMGMGPFDFEIQAVDFIQEQQQESEAQ